MPDGESIPEEVKKRGLSNDVNGFVVFYNMTCGTRGFTMPPHMVPFARGLLDPRIEKLLITVGPGSGKALHPDTLVLFKDGWRPIGSAQVGDFVQSPNSKLVKVSRVLRQPDSLLWSVRLEDGTVISAHSEHVWLVHHTVMRGGEYEAGGCHWQLKTTAEIASGMQFLRSTPWYVPRGGLGRRSFLDTPKLRIVSVDRQRVVAPSICISLDSDDGLFLTQNYVVTHNSTMLSEVFPAFLLGHDPSMSILGISAGEALMQGFLRSVMETIEWAPIYQHLFPKVRPDKSAGWSSERGMFVTGREIGNPDASFAAAGVDSKSLTGKHGRLILCDDLHDKENSGTIDQCEKVWDTWFNTILGRADPRGARYIVAGRRWNQHDLYARLAATGEFVVMSLPAERENTGNLWVDVQVPDGLVCCFTEELEKPVSNVNIVKRRRIRLED